MRKQKGIEEETKDLLRAIVSLNGNRHPPLCQLIVNVQQIIIIIIVIGRSFVVQYVAGLLVMADTRGCHVASRATQSHWNVSYIISSLFHIYSYENFVRMNWIGFGFALFFCIKSERNFRTTGCQTNWRASHVATSARSGPQRASLFTRSREFITGVNKSSSTLAITSKNWDTLCELARSIAENNLTTLYKVFSYCIF